MTQILRSDSHDAAIQTAQATRTMKGREKILITAAAAVTLLFAGCAGDYYGVGYESPYYGGQYFYGQNFGIHHFRYNHSQSFHGGHGNGGGHHGGGGNRGGGGGHGGHGGGGSHH